MNATLLQSQFRIRKDNFAPAVYALTQWVKETKSNLFDPDFAIVNNTGDNAPTVNLIGAFQQFGLDVGFEKETGDVDRVCQRNFEQPDDEHAPAFGRLVTVIEPGSYFLFHRDDDELVRWRWGTDGRFHVEEGGTVFFGERDSLLMEVRGTLQIIRNDLARGAFTPGPTYLKRIDTLLQELREPPKPE